MGAPNTELIEFPKEKILAHAYPPYGILNIIFCSKTGVFDVFAMLGTPKPMEEIAPRHHKVFFLCLRHKNPSRKIFQKNPGPKSVTTSGTTYTRTPQQELRLRAMPPGWGFGALAGGLGRHFFTKK